MLTSGSKGSWVQTLLKSIDFIVIGGTFINYVRVPREGAGLEKSLHTLTLGGSNWSFYVIFSKSIFYIRHVGLGGLGVTCSPRDPRFAGSNPAEVDGSFQDVNILSTSPPEGTSSWGFRFRDFRLVKEPQA